MKMKTVIAGTVIAGEAAAMKITMNTTTGVIMAEDAVDMMKMMKMNMDAAMSGAVVTKTKIMMKMTIGKERVMMRMMRMKIATVTMKAATHVAAVTENDQEEEGSVA
jgi:hypothetical protein